jgi:hypothetical protein
MQNDARREDVTDPNEFGELRQRQERRVRHWRMATKVIDVLIVLALAVIAALVLKMIFF